jgi:hypothetical protein
MDLVGSVILLLGAVGVTTGLSRFVSSPEPPLHQREGVSRFEFRSQAAAENPYTANILECAIR